MSLKPYKQNPSTRCYRYAKKLLAQEPNLELMPLVLLTMKYVDTKRFGYSQEGVMKAWKDHCKQFRKYNQWITKVSNRLTGQSITTIIVDDIENSLMHKIMDETK